MLQQCLQLMIKKLNLLKEFFMEKNRLYRLMKESWVAGVAAGLGRYFGLDPIIFRIVFIALAFLGGGGVILYIFLWIVLPEYKATEGYDESKDEQVRPVYQTSEVPSPEIEKEKKMKGGAFAGGVLLIVLGVLFLLQEFVGLSFEKLWPVIIILVGVLLVFRGFYKS